MTNLSLLSPSVTEHRCGPLAVSTQQNCPWSVSTTAVNGTDNTSSCRASTSSTLADMPGLSPSIACSSMVVSYLTMFPSHQPAGRATADTEETWVSSVPSGSSTLAFVPRLTRSTTDS